MGACSSVGGPFNTYVMARKWKNQIDDVDVIDVAIGRKFEVGC